MTTQPIIQFSKKMEDCDVHFNSQLIRNAIQILRPNSFIIWLDLVMQIDFTGKASAKRYKDLYGISASTVRSALTQLEEYGFLICQNEDLGMYLFNPEGGFKDGLE